MLKGLRFFNRTSDRRIFGLASYHSPHSLTWSWSLRFRRHQFYAPKPYAYIGAYGSGAAIGLGQMIGFSARHDAHGWQISVSLLWCSLDWARQTPMWFRDLYWAKVEEEEHAKTQRYSRVA